MVHKFLKVWRGLRFCCVEFTQYVVVSCYYFSKINISVKGMANIRNNLSGCHANLGMEEIKGNG